MAQTVGIVIETQGDGHATVMAERAQGCSSCSAVSHCFRVGEVRAETTTALNQAGASVGDRVTLMVASAPLLSRMAVLYLVPVGGMLTGAFMGAIGNANGSTDGRSIIFGLVGFLLGFALSVAISRILSSHRPILPVITRIIRPGSPIAAVPPVASCGCGKN